MANDNKEIGEIVKKCKILLLDIEGTTTSISFVKDKLFPYAEENVKQFLESQWEKEGVKEAVAALRKQSVEDKEGNVEGVVEIPGEDEPKEAQIEGLVANVKWQMAADRKAGPLKQLQGLIWKQGYDNGDIKGHVYDDVSPALEQWRATDGQKVYIYSSGSVQAQKLLFGQSLAGDLLKHIDGHFDTAVGGKQEAASYTNIVEKIGGSADEILFLTDIPKEAEAARSAGLQTALVSREGNAPLPAAAGPVLHSLAALAPSNKRKPEPQDEIPAKVPKTDSDEDVKTSSSDTEATETPASKEHESTEKMEVEDEQNGAADKEKVVVEECTDANEPVAAMASDAEPIIEEKQEEKEEKTEEKETEKMEVENGVTEKTTNGHGKSPDTEEAAAAVEITEVTEPELSNVGEMIEGLEPVVEEPPASEDMEELQNVGEVLEKECDEILSKVQDVTNLENIPVKPLLNPITEETMDTENTDSNDIVDRILDTELDLEMKQCGDIDLNTVSEGTEAANKVDANGTEEKPESHSVENSDETPTEEKEAKEVTDTKLEESSKIEKEPEEAKPEETQNTETTNKDVPAVAVPETETTTEAPKSEPTEAEVKAATEEVKTVTEVPASTEEEKTAKSESDADSIPATETVAATEAVIKDTTSVTEEAKPEESKPENGDEPHVNGKTNANGDVAVNGDVSKDEELNARLSVANGTTVVNGSNGDSMVEKGQGDCKVEAGEIKVKTVTTEEPRTDPIDQPTEA